MRAGRRHVPRLTCVAGVSANTKGSPGVTYRLVLVILIVFVVIIVVHVHVS